MAYDNLNASNIKKKILDRLDRLERSANLNNSSMTDGTMYVQGGQILVTNAGRIDVQGSLAVSGSTTLTGTLTQSGTTTFTGTTNLNGPTNIQGTTSITGDTTVDGGFETTSNVTLGGPTVVSGGLSINGNTNVNGTLTTTNNVTLGGPTVVDGGMSINGNTNVNGTMRVQAGGTLIVGGTTIDPSTGDGAIQFATGAKLQGEAGGASLNSGVSAVTVLDDFVGVGNSSVSLQIVSGSPPKFVGLTTTTQAANAYIDATGRIYRSTA